MGAYQVIYGVLIILVLIPIWIIISNTTNVVSESFTDILPAQIESFTLGSTVIYYYLFFATLIIFIWMYKTSVEENKKSEGYYG